MGACLGDSNLKRKNTQDQPLQATTSLDGFSNSESALNPELDLKLQKTSSVTLPSSNPNSNVPEVEPEKEEEDLNALFGMDMGGMDLGSTLSVIIRKGVKRSGEKPSKQEVMESFQSDNYEGEVIQERNCSKLIVRNENVEFEFGLPRCRAGPLIVPHLLYDKYCLA